MSRMTARTGRTVAALIGGIALAGCHFAVVPPKATGSPRAPSTPAGNASAQRLADAPALLVQCAIDRAGLRPAAGQNWLHDGKVSITSTNAADFDSWWRGHDTPGPYTETFVIDGHRTHYLARRAYRPGRGAAVPVWLGDLGRAEQQAPPRGLRHLGHGPATPGPGLRRRPGHRRPVGRLRCGNGWSR